MESDSESIEKVLEEVSSHPRCLDTSSNIFTLDLCNIRGLRSNLQSVKHVVQPTPNPTRIK